MAGAERETVEVFNGNHPGRSRHVDARKYGEMRRVLLEFLPADEPGATRAQMLAGVPALLSGGIFPGGETAGWWLETVQLDLEARGILERSRGTPTRWRRKDGGAEDYPLPAPNERLAAVPTGRSAQAPVPRPRHDMPEWVRSRLETAGLIGAYEARPPYQRKDYLGWIMQAAREETRERRLAQMLDELARGDRYMKMAYRPGGRGSGDR